MIVAVKVRRKLPKVAMSAQTLLALCKVMFHSSLFLPTPTNNKSTVSQYLTTVIHCLQQHGSGIGLRLSNQCDAVSGAENGIERPYQRCAAPNPGR